MLFGAAYYPEHWGRDRLETDAALMCAAGFNVVRMGEFAWGTMQRAEHAPLDLGWLDDTIEYLGKRGIKTILGTPTATPPKWLMDAYPETYVTDIEGKRWNYGSRRHYCVNSRAFLRLAEALVGQLAAHYRDNPYVIGWQIDNELGGDKDTCYCPNCKRAFDEWLHRKYGDIASLNERWGTDVWSHNYSDFSQIEPPMYTQSLQNPSLHLDYYRFHSDGLIEFMERQAALLRRENPGWMITSNNFGLYAVTDNYKMSQGNDSVAWDCYPNLFLFGKVMPYAHAVGCDACRGFKHKPFIRMETQSGTPGGDILFQTPRPGSLAKWPIQAIAHGAGGILFFRWRTSSAGPEEYWHGILNHDGVPRRLYNELTALGKDMQRIVPALDGLNRNRVAIVHDQQIHWAFKIQPLIIGYSYYEHLKTYYKALFDANIGCDMINPEQSFDGYDTLILPNFLFYSAHTHEKLKQFVQNGGQIIMDYRSGVKDVFGRMMQEPLPAGYSDILGVTVTEYGLIFNFETAKVEGEINGGGGQWFDVVEPNGATAVSRFKTDEYYDGLPAITRNDYGKGRAWYVATALSEDAMAALIACTVPKDALPVTAPPAVEVTRRGALYFVINHGTAAADVAVNGLTDVLLGGRPNRITLPPNGYAVFKE